MGVDSLRQISNRTLSHAKDINIQSQITDPKEDKILSFDLVLGNLCNLKCIMCRPMESSQLLTEALANPTLAERYQERLGEKYGKDALSQKQFDWPRQKEFKQWCEKYLPQAVHIKFTGGEPLIIPWVKEVISKIPDQQKKNCVLHFTSNLTIVEDQILSEFAKFKEVWLSVSVEGTGKTHEYVRFGHKWSTLVSNIEKIQKNNTNNNVILSINHVVQAPSFHDIESMVNYFDNKKLKIHPIMIIGPKHFHISALSKYAKLNYIKFAESYKGFNMEFVEYVKDVAQKYLDQNSDLTGECIAHLKDLDNVRKNNYRSVIPVENLAVM